MEFQGPSFPLTWTLLQSITENRPYPPTCKASSQLRSSGFKSGQTFSQSVVNSHQRTPIRKPLNAWKITTTSGAHCKGPTTVILKVRGAGLMPMLFHLDSTAPRCQAWTSSSLMEDWGPGRPGNLSKDSHRADQRMTSPVSRLNTKCKVCAHILT